jgi:hypothetical protein
VVEAEREACAQAVEAIYHTDQATVAAAIRARSYNTGDL